jgi:hypothetical protein
LQAATPPFCARGLGPGRRTHSGSGLGARVPVSGRVSDPRPRTGPMPIFVNFSVSTAEKILTKRRNSVTANARVTEKVHKNR